MKIAALLRKKMSGGNTTASFNLLIGKVNNE
jgi:hypothetical protein